MKGIIAVVGLSAAILLAAAAPPAEAGTKSLWPNQFTPSSWSVSVAENEQFARKNTYWLGAVGGVATFEADARLPVGRIITGFLVNASTVSGAPAVEAYLVRARLGGPNETVAALELTGYNDKDWYAAATIDVPRVAGGYRYWVHLDVNGGDAYVYGVKVRYR